MPTFTGPGFHLDSVESTGFSTVQVTFSQFPKLVDPTASNDGLNPGNYSLTGPGLNYIISVAPVAGDPLSVNCTTASPLLVGGWELAVVNIVEDTLAALQVPTALSFVVTQQPAQTSLSSGATNDEAEDVMRKFMNPTLKGVNWSAVLAGIAAGDQTNWDNAKLAFDQLFLSTASGKYLDQRAGDQGEKRPQLIGMDDDLFRELALTVKNKKLTEEAILEVLKVFYGIDAVQASITSTVAEPYALNDGDTLTIVIDEKQSVTVTFSKIHFARISVALAIEVAAEITRALKAAGSTAIAESYTDPTTGLNSVRIYSGSLGLTSSIRITGGVAQTTLQFPTDLFSEPFTSTAWTWAPSTVNPGYLRFTGGSFYNLDLVQSGDLAYIYGTPFTGAGIDGTFTVSSTGAYYVVSNPSALRQQWFEVFAPSVTSGSGTQTDFTSLMFFRPKKFTVYDSVRHVLVFQTDGTVDVSIPATTQAVVRMPGTGAYLKSPAAIALTSLERDDGINVQASTSAPHGLSVGDQIQVDGVFPTGEMAPIGAATPSGDFSGNIAVGVTENSLQTSVSLTSTFQGVDFRAMRLREGIVMTVGGQTITFSGALAIPNPVILEITADVIGGAGGHQQTYKWTNNTTVVFTIGRRQFGASVLSHSLSSITDNRVLATGGTNGDDSTGASLNTWDLFAYSNSPAQNTKVNGTMPVARAGHAQACLADYELICGGWTTAGTPIASTYSFDHTALTWTLQGAMLRARMKHQLNAYQVGTHIRGLATGGQNAASILNHCEVFEADTGLWRVVGQMTYARYDHAAVTIPDGRTIVFGGTGYNPTQSTTPVALASCEIYDPNTEIWSRLDPMRAARTKPAIAYLPSRNAIYVTGGGLTSIEIFDLTTMTWTKPMQMLNFAFNDSVGVLLGVDTFVAIGGVAV